MIFSTPLCTCIYKLDHDQDNCVLHPHVTFYNPEAFSSSFPLAVLNQENMFKSCNARVDNGFVGPCSGLAFPFFVCK
jgi:hypothetical protein